MSAPRVRRHRATLAVLAGLVAAVVVVLVAGGGVATHGVALDPDNPDPEGGRAVARVLSHEGVDVTVVRSADALEDVDVAGATVLVTSTNALGESTAARLLDHTGEALLVVAEPGPGATAALGLTAAPYRVALHDARPAGCADPAYAGLSVRVDRAAEFPVPGGCFRGEHGALLAEPRPGLVVLGAGELLHNDQVLRADNAAVALRLLGGRDQLVWYVPSLDDLVGDDGVSATTLLPGWLRPALLLLALATIALLLWRVRRLGPLATEPLPVVVRAIETTRSRGRLYRKAGDRAHAATALRAAARGRIARQLGLDEQTAATAVVDDLAERTGRPREELRRLLAPDAPPPTTDHDLIALADRLAELDREVRRP